VVNIPRPQMDSVSDFAGTTTIDKTDKCIETDLTQLAAAMVAPPLLAECPVNLECRVAG
jgi:flavin reductase (DIM6/NTAB) family NADH-FMN oxidoreductase RutF